MADSKVANRYASSLLETALEKNSLDRVYKDLILLIENFDKSIELRRAIESPVIKPGVKFSILKELFSKKMAKVTLNFFQFVIDKNREDVLYLIAKRFIDFRNEHLGIVVLDVKTVYKLDEDQKQMIKARFEKTLKKTVNLNLETDDSIIGGFIAKVGDTVYDASIQHQLELLKKEFGQGSISLY